MRGTVPTWLESLLGLSAAEAGEGTVWHLEYVWPLSPTITLLASAAVVLIYHRRFPAST